MTWRISFFDKRVISKFSLLFSIISGTLSFALLFNFIPKDYTYILPCIGYSAIGVLIIGYMCIWCKLNKLTNIRITIDGSDVIVKVGDLFEEEGYKAIAFNEYFDTQVDGEIISEKSLNGIFIKKHLSESLLELDEYIRLKSKADDILDPNFVRSNGGKTIKYKISSIVVYNDYLLTAFSKFDEHNNARLSMPEYIEFLINFWDRVNRVYAQESVSVPIFGSGMTRIKEHKNISDEDLLKIMLWTFKLSETKFKYPAKLSIIIHKDKISKINLLDISSIEKGL